MQKHYSHTDKIRGLAGRMLGLTALGVSLLPSCSEDHLTDGGPDDAGRSMATIHIEVSSFYGNDSYGSRAYVDGNTDENRINNIWLFQYNAATGESLKTPVYYEDFDLNDIETDLTPNDGGAQSVVCIVANINDENWALSNGIIKSEFDTLDKLRKQTLSGDLCEAFLSGNMGPKEDDGKTIPMYGESKVMSIVQNKSYVSVPLIRMMAKMSVSVKDVSAVAQMGVTVKNISVSNIPYYCRLESLSPADGDDVAASYPDTVEWRDFDDESSVYEITLYFPENLQGKASGMTSKAGATTGIPDKALAVNLTVSYNKDGTDKTHTYTVYPGLDMVNDFNIKRNYVYNVSILITKLPE